MLHVISRGSRALLLAATITLGAILTTFTGIASAAEVETQAQTNARASVEAMAAKLGAATTEAQALQDQRSTQIANWAPAWAALHATG